MSDFAVTTVLTSKDAGVSENLDKIAAKAEKAHHKMEKFKEGFKEAFSFGAFAGMGAKLGEGIVEGVKKAAEALPEFAEKVEAIGRSSSKLGLAAEDFQRLSYAMKMTNIPAETMEKSFKKLNVGMAQLRVHQGPLLEGLKRMNPELMGQIMGAKDSKSAFLATAEAIQKETNAQKRAAIAQAVFGKGGQDLLPILMKGKDGINDLMKEADKYGDVISDKTITAGENFSDSLKHITASMTALKDTALAGLLEGVAPVADKMAEWLATNKQFIQSSISSVVGVITSLFSKIVPPLARIVQSLLPVLGRLIDKIAPVLGILLGMLGDIFSTLLPILDPVLNLFDALAPALSMVAGLLQVVAKIVGGQLSLTFKIFGFYINSSMMIWSQSIGRLIEMMLSGVSFIMAALGQDTSGIDKTIKALQDMRKSSTEAVFGKDKGGALSSVGSAALGGQSTVVNQIKVDVQGVPEAKVGVKSESSTGAASGRSAPKFSRPGSGPR